MKKLPGEVRFFVIAWLLFVPALVLYFTAQIVSTNAQHMDLATLANWGGIWPVAAIGFLTICAFVEMGAYVKFKTGFFSAWSEAFWSMIEK